MSVRIAIVGGGFTGAAIALHLASDPSLDAAIAVFEPRPRLGGGVAYSSREPAHRINVPAARMSLFPDRKSDFVDWIAASGITLDPGALRPDGALFPQRGVFGAYVADRLALVLGSGRVTHRLTRVAAVAREHGLWRIASGDAAEPESADLLVIATTHPAPEPPPVLSRGLGGHPGFVADPWEDDALDRIGPEDRVLIVGTGLSMADVVAALDRRGHRGPILAVSRRGLLSKGHPEGAVPQTGDFLDPPEPSSLGLLRRIRASVAEAAAAGFSWHGVLDRVRDQGGGIWRAMPVEERRRLVRHLRPYWDTHRFRVAPQLEEILARRADEGSLRIAAARVVAARTEGRMIEIDLRLRNGGHEHLAVEAVVTTTGPAHGAVIAREPFLAGLARESLIEAAPIGLGLHADPTARALVGDRTIPNLFIGGPLARGTVGELMGLPEVALHAAFVAREVSAASLALGQAGLGVADTP